VDEITQAIDLDASNPLLYNFRGLISQGMGNFPLGRQDTDTAVRLAPKGWIMPYYVRGNESLVTSNLAEGIDAYTRIIETRPQDWHPYNQRGYLYFLAHKYEEARADIDKSIELGPEAEWPYMWGMLIALRQGRLEDVPVYTGSLMSNQSKNPVFVQRFMTALFGEDNAKLLGYSIAAVGHLSFGQFDVAAKEADTVLAVMPNYAEMYLIKGLSYCNNDENEKAEEAYSAGLKVDPTFSILHLLRAEVRGKLGDVTGAQEDLSIVAQSDIRENLKPYIEAAQSGQFSCKDMMANK
jgi:lipoprotein NlpI